MTKVAEGNKTFRILSCISILLILLGHLDCNILEFGGLFPYYSYHVMIFVFIAGYFYKNEDEKQLKNFLYRKLKKLIIPYYLLNLLAGLLTAFLMRYEFFLGSDFNLRNLILEPFLSGHQFMIIAPGWFVPALVLFELCNILGRKLLAVLKLDNEYLIMGLYLILGLLAIYLSKRGSVYDYYRVPARIMFMAPVFQFGRIYRTKLEARDTVKSWIYIPVLVVINLILCYTQAGLAFSAAWVNGFNNGIWVPYLTILTGIALWLRISRILANYIGNGTAWRVVSYVGSHTFAICMLHLSAFLLLNLLLWMIGLKGFDLAQFKTNVYYAYNEFGTFFKLIYALVGIKIPLLLCHVKDWLVHRISNE